jgi:hypothetical protein
MTRRTFITAPDESEADAWLRALARPPLEAEHNPQPEAQSEPAHPERAIAPAPHGARPERARPASGDDFLRAMGVAAITGDPDWINHLPTGWQPFT